MAHDTPDGHDEKDAHTGRGSLERRSFLALAGAASVAGGGLLASGTGDAQAERHGVSFDRVLHAVDDLGMDASGNQSISSALQNAAGDGTLVVFPPGTYRVTSTLSLNSVSNFGIAGESGDRHDVEFVTDSGNALDWIVASGGRNHVYENFTMQQTRDEKTSFSNVFKLATGLHIENVELAGWNPRDDIYDTKPGMKPHITTRDGVGVMKNFVCTGGGVVDTYPARRVPIWMGPSHKGELRLVNANIQESGSHSIYASRTNGCIRVEGGLFKNNDNTNLRISSGHPDKTSWIRGAEIVIDTNAARHLPSGERYQQTRGIRVESGFQGWSGLLIEDVDIVAKSTPNSAGLIVVEDNHGAVTVRNTRIENDVDGVPFINAKQPNYSSVDSPYRLVLDNVNMTGDAANVGSAVRIRGRNGSVVQNACVHRQHGDGVKILGSDNCAVENSNVNVPGRATVFRNSTVSTSGITHGDTCPLPSFDGAGADVDGEPLDSGGWGTDLDHRLDVTGGGAGDVVDYEFSVSEALEAVALNDEDEVDGLVGRGAVAGGTDSFGFTGDLTGFTASGDLSVEVDGSTVDHTQFGEVDGGSTDDGSTDDGSTDDGSTDDGSTDDGSGDSLDRLVTIEGHSVRANYEFTVTGGLEKSTDGGASVNDEDVVDGSTATGAVWGGTDAYRFSGDVVAFDLDTVATVTVDGEEVDPDALGDDGATLDRTIELTGGGTGDVVDYEFSVDGGLRYEGQNPEDAVEGSTATGAVSGGTDTYSFSGEVVEVATSDPDGLTVTVDGDPLDVARWALPNRFVVDGTGQDGTTEYAFRTTGRVVDDVEVGPLEDGDDTDGRSVSGSVTGDVDGFRFAGDLVELRLDGSASIEFEDNDG